MSTTISNKIVKAVLLQKTSMPVIEASGNGRGMECISWVIFKSNTHIH